MNKTFYKYTLLIEVVFFITLGIVIFIDVDILFNLTKNILPTRPDNLSNVIYVLLPPCITVLSMLIAIIWRNVVFAEFPDENDSNEINNKKRLRSQNFWRFSFYMNTLLNVVILIFLIFVLLDRMQEDYFSEDYLFNILFNYLIIGGLFFGTTFFGGGLLLGISVIWQTNKSASVLNAIIIIGMLLISATIINLNFFSNKYSSPETDTAILQGTVSPSEDYVSGQNEEPEDEAEETNFLSSLWKNPDMDRSIITNLIEYILKETHADQGEKSVEFIRTQIPIIGGYYVDRRDEEKKLDTIMAYVGRDGYKLKKTFLSYQDIFYRLLPPNVYKKSGTENMIQALLAAYSDINENERSEETWRTLYDLMKDGNKGNAINYYNDIQKYISDDVLKVLVVKDENENIKGNVVWAYSFWARRYNEGNNSEVYDIIIKIKEHYNDE